MKFNEHLKNQGQHAFLSASNYHWVNYDDDKLISRFKTAQAAAIGTRLHAFAKEAILLGVKLPRSKKTLNAYVNDAIGFKMTPEQVLYYSDNCFGTADAISYNGDILRIHDLKTGVSPSSMTQLLIYTALFSLEYDVRLSDLQCELRIYKDDDIQVYTPEIEELAYIVDRIISFDKLIESLKREVLL